MTYEHDESMELVEAVASLEEGFLLRHIWNRITTADLSKHTFENTRAALARPSPGSPTRRTSLSCAVTAGWAAST